jgi:hypothetical protein
VPDDLRASVTPDLTHSAACQHHEAVRRIHRVGVSFLSSQGAFSLVGRRSAPGGTIMLMKQVLIFGAGFSHAIADQMPMTNVLADQIMDHLRADGVDVPATAFSGSQFEAWLSRLAEPQPDLDEARNADNRALFIRVTKALREVMMQRQNDAYAAGPPWWLRRLVGAMHFSHSTAMTFNYDMMVEATVSQSGLFDGDGNRVRADDIVRYMPRLVEAPSRGGGLRPMPGAARSFRYIKLHGSLDTFWVLGDSAGETIARWSLSGGWNRPVIESEDERRHALPGREPFLVPPTATKSAFYANPLSRQLWQDAAAALREADEVVLIGYSIPVTDMVTSGMLGDALGSNASRITIVNPNPDGVRDRLTDLGIEVSRIGSIDGPDPCSAFVEAFESSFSPAFGGSVPGSDLPLAAGVASAAFQVNGIERITSDGTAVLRAGEVWRNASYARHSSSWVSLQDVAAAGVATRAKVVWPSGEEAFVARAAPENGPSGADELVLLRVTAMPPIDHP